MKIGIRNSLPLRSGLWLTVLLVLLVPSPFISIGSARASTLNSVPYPDHGFAALASGDRVTQGTLESWTGGNMTVAGFEQAIQVVLVPVNVREVLLDIGWQNYTAGDPQYQAWVSNWLTACDAMGVSNVLYVGQLTSQGYGSPWVESLLGIDPTVATYYPNGTQAQFVSLDNPEVARYLETDLGQLYSYYGNHPSWVGLGTGSSQNDPYYVPGETTPAIGYSNLSLSAFVNSRYYAADVNASGYLQSGALDSLWSEFRSIQPAIVLSSGLWMTSSPWKVYGSGSGSNLVEMRFRVPSNSTQLQLLWYGSKEGNPATLSTTILEDKNGAPDGTVVVGRADTSASTFTNTTGWQSGILIDGNFSAGWYWAEFSSPSSNSDNQYVFYLKDYLVNNATAYPLQPGIGPGARSGISTILWVKNQAGNNLAIYPYQQEAVGAPPETFTATHVYSFNTVFLFLSDRAYNTANATLRIADVTNGDRVVATGLLSQALDQGLENWIPITLNSTVTTAQGHQYSLSVIDPSVTWTTVMRYIVTDPPLSGFQNQSQTVLFQLGNLNWSQGVRNWGEMTSNGNDAVGAGQMDAVRFSPSHDETLSFVQILMSSNTGSNLNYTSGTFSAAIWASSPDGSKPAGGPIKQVTMLATNVPRNGLLNISGFNTPLTAGKDYWLVFSANSSERFSFGRLTSPYEFPVLGSANGGGTWYDPSEGPTEYAFTISLSGETLGTFVTGSISVPLTSDSIFAQPFVASSTESVEGLYIGPLIHGPHLLVSIDPTGAFGKPTVSPLGYGVYDAGNITLDYGPEFVQFSSVANLQKGQEYWIEVRPLGSSYSINALSYLNSAPDIPKNSGAFVSDDSGLSWKSVSNDSSFMSEYLLETSPTSPPLFGTATLFQDLSANHNYPVSSGILHGWNAYVQAAELSTFSSVAEWLSKTSDRQFQFFGNAQANVINQLGLKGIVVLPIANSTSSCAGLLATTESSIASGERQFTFAPLARLQQCDSQGTTQLAQQLNYLPYVGPNFGLTTSNSVLVVGDGASANITGFLSNSYNVTYANLALDPSLEGQGNLSSFRSILWVPTDNVTITPSLQHALGQYVRTGHELVTTSAALSDLGILAPETKGNSSTVFTNASSFLKTAVAHTNYTIGSFQTTSTNLTLSARSRELSISASALGSGRFVYVAFGNQLATTSADQSVILSNILSMMTGAVPPIWFGTVGGQATSIEYRVQGRFGGPLLLWVYNPSNSPSVFSLELNGSYYGVPSSWKTLQMPGPVVTLGSGSDVRIDTNVPPSTLVGIIVAPRNYPLISYSSGFVETQFAYPNQSVYSIAGTYNQSILFLISTNKSADQIILDGKTSLAQFSSASQLFAANSGWYFDQATGSLFVKYQSTGVDSIRFLLSAAQVAPPTVIPEQSLITIFEVALAAEAATLIVLVFRSRQSRQKQPTTNSQKG